MPVNIVNNGPNLNPIFKERIDRATGGEWSGKAYHIPLDSVASDGPAQTMLLFKSELDKAQFRARDNPGVGSIAHAAAAAAETLEMARKEEPAVASAVDQVLGQVTKDLNPEFPELTILGERDALGTMDQFSVGALGYVGGENGYAFMPKGVLFVDYTYQQPGFDVVLAKRGDWET